MPQPIFYFARLKPWDWITIILYVVISLVLFIYLKDMHDLHRMSKILMGYGFATQGFLYFFNYRSMRNLWVYLFWVAVAVVHLWLYFNLPMDAALTNGLRAMRNTIILVVLFQVLRFISARTQGQELVAISRPGGAIWDERKITFIDFLLAIIYVMTMLGLYMV